MSLGERLKGTDVYHAGIATHFVASKEVEFYHCNIFWLIH